MVVPGANHVYLEVRKQKPDEIEATTILRIQGMGKNLHPNGKGLHYTYSPLLADFTKAEFFVNQEVMPFVFHRQNPPRRLESDQFYQNYKPDYFLIYQGTPGDILLRVIQMANAVKDINTQCLPYNTFWSNSNAAISTVVAAAGLTVPPAAVVHAPGYLSPFTLASHWLNPFTKPSDRPVPVHNDGKYLVQLHAMLDEAIDGAMSALKNQQILANCAQEKSRRQAEFGLKQ